MEFVQLVPVCQSVEEIDTWLKQFKAFIDLVDADDAKKLKTIKYAVSKLGDVIQIDGRSTYATVIQQLEELQISPATYPLKAFMELQFGGDLIEFVRQLRKLAKRVVKTQAAVDDLIRQRLIEMMELSQRPQFESDNLGAMMKKMVQIRCEDIFEQPGARAFAIGDAICTKCNRKGHSAKFCWKDKVCEKCGQKGHIKRVCREKDSKN